MVEPGHIHFFSMEQMVLSGSSTRRLLMSCAMGGVGQRLTVLDRGSVAGLERVSFQVTATRKDHARLLRELQASDATGQVAAFTDQEGE